ncbi:WhiB family transcriptional regulator [Planomonospora sp. ID67723]|uniref:WhiB family transcriptional regulator n=1 Tax=Planomonospora sp. ID67723 TaxID=2738134 RepID=UPI0018C4141C|nr:WhiB family transcriptional regulator [Planomonospora sp. ID67723]MBG0828514.1 WhiB family transcriptional regulator [Planomonospora sp. ID67723]
MTTRFEYMPLNLPAPVPEWHRDTPCGGQGAIMSARTPADERRARQICEDCPVRAECSQWVLALKETDDPGGICGGWSENERRRMRLGWSPHETRCRCLQCKARKARQRLERIAQARANPELIDHGTVTGFMEYGCRCEACDAAGEPIRAAWAKNNRRRRQAAREAS